MNTSLTANDVRDVGARRRSISLGEAWRVFWAYPSPWLISATVLVAGVARIAQGEWLRSDLVLVAVLVATFPVVEWLVHVILLHWKPRRVGRATIDPLVARKHREHHADPRVTELIFIPFQTLVVLLVVHLGVAFFAFSQLALGLTYLVSVAAIGFVYEWTHYLIHSDYRPKRALYRAVWRNHRLHHYKSERYWFTVTTSSTADRLFGTYPDPRTVETSPTARNLLGAGGERA